ncbi:MAG TPA: S41 family peptidase [Luteibaculaceae bacterium]|nr:S41 family peptidase [Luteibaculaceae bacterium]
MKFLKCMVLLFMIAISHGIQACGSDSTSKKEMDHKLVTLCRAWGVLKYYHPAVYEGLVDWDQELLTFLEHFSPQSSVEVFLTEALDKLDSAVAPKKFITKEEFAYFTCNQYRRIDKLNFLSDSIAYPITPDFDWIRLDENLSSRLKFRLCNTIVNSTSYKKRRPSKKIILNLKENPYPDQSTPELPHRILALFRYWNVINYYFPYKDYMDQPWDSIIADEMDVFWNADSRVTYINAIGEISAKTNDSHSTVRALPQASKSAISGPVKAAKFMPFNFREIDSKFYISKSLRPELNGYVGSEVVAVNQVQLDDWKRLYSKLHACSTPQALANHFDHMISMIQFQDTFSLTLVNEKDKRHVSFTQGVSGLEKINSNYNDSVPHYKFINDSIGYLNIAEARSGEVQKAFKLFRKTKGLIIDLRGYPEGLAIQMLPKHFSRIPVNSAEYYYPSFRFPGAFKKAKEQENYFVENRFLGVIKVLGLLPYEKVFPTFNKMYQGQVAILINNEAISAAETTAMILKAYCKNEIFIGQPTMGANGNIAFVDLPGSVKVSYSSLHWHYPDGTRLQRIGIIPDILVEESPVDFINQKDPFIESAVGWFQQTNVKD